MDSVSPVWTDAETHMERVIALDQEQYIPLMVLPVRYHDGARGLSCRFRLSDAERQAIADGADFVITEMTFGLPFTPIQVMVVKPNEYPE